MKKITLNYNDKGYICNNYDDGEFYIAQQEDKAVIISATFPGNLVGSVNAYVKSGSGGDVIENCGTIDINKHTVELALDSKYLAYNYLKVGFEVKTSTKEIRFEPLTLEVDEFVNVTGSSAPSPYTVSVKVGNVTQLESDEEPTITNSGNNKHLVLNFGIPKGDKGDTGPKGVKGDKGDKGDRGERGADGKDGINGADGKDGYTPQKGVDYFTAQDIKSLGIDDKVDKVDGKGLSTNDFTDGLKKRVEENTFDGYIRNPEDNPEIDYDQYTTSGIYKVYSDYGDEQYSSILIVKHYFDGSAEQIETDGEYAFKRVKDENGKWTEWQKIYVSQTDLDNAIGDVETSLENIIAKYGLGGDGV